MPNHFIAQFTVGGGPDPQLELDRILSQAEPTDTAPHQDTAWFPTKVGAKGWVKSKDSQCLVFCKARTGGVDAIHAQVIDVSETMPNDPVVRDFYSEHDFPVWWKVTDVQRTSFDSVDEIPGVSMTGKSAIDAFSGNATFAFWSFGDVSIDASGEKKESRRPSSDIRVQPSPNALARNRPSPSRPSPSVRPDTPTGPLLFHGVDFSGGVETARQGNGKIWIATWDVDRDEVTLESGAEGCFRRADLPSKVVANKGWWVFDFPFGIARDTASALHLEDWDAWLAWCYGVDRPEGYATLRRDSAKTAVEEAGFRWAIRRTIDEDLGTTWFPMFEQLYRQTIYGASEVLFPMRTQHVDSVAILPWGQPTESKAVVLEGFPGITIRERLGLPATGYKGKGNDRRIRRKEIMSALTRDWKLPVRDEDIALAINDTEGDAVDALVLVIACQISYALDRTSWQASRDRLKNQGRIVEGWFPS